MAVKSSNEGPMVLPRAFNLLRLLAEQPAGLTLSELASAVEAPKSTLSVTLKSLANQEVIERKGNIYRLGTEAYSLASAILAGRTLPQICRPYLERAVEQCGESALLAVIDSKRKELIYIEIVEPEKDIRYSVDIGTRRPLHSTACGRVFLAYASVPERKSYLSDVSASECDPESLAERLRQIRETSLSVTLGEYNAEVAGFAAPVFGVDGELVGAVTLALPLTRGEREGELFSTTVLQASRSISRVLGHQ
jgi:IclR family transcriptional regulator, acetate operon repressor